MGDGKRAFGSSLFPAVVATLLFSGSVHAGTGDNFAVSDKYGTAGYFGLPFLGRQIPDEPVELLSPKAMTSGEIADLFGALCLAAPFDRTAYETALTTKASDFVPRKVTLSQDQMPKPLLGVHNIPQAQFSQEQSSYGIATMWTGENIEALDNRYYVRYPGGVVITGPEKSKNLYAPQCNLYAHVTGLTSGTDLVTKIHAIASDYRVDKRVDKRKYSYAVLSRITAENKTMRVTIDASRLNKADQIVHLTLQMLPSGSQK